MNAAALREACLAMTGAEETFPFGPENSVFKVEGKIFALSRLAGEPPLRISLKCDPGLAEQLRASHPAISPGYHLNKRHWNTVVLDGSVPDAMVRDMIEDSETPASLATARCVTPSTPSVPMRRIVASMIAVRIALADGRRTALAIWTPTVQLYCRGV